MVFELRDSCRLRSMIYISCNTMSIYIGDKVSSRKTRTLCFVLCTNITYLDYTDMIAI